MNGMTKEAVVQELRKARWADLKQAITDIIDHFGLLNGEGQTAGKGELSETIWGNSKRIFKLPKIEGTVEDSTKAIDFISNLIASNSLHPWQESYLLTKHARVFSPRMLRASISPEAFASWMGMAPQLDSDRWTGANGNYLILRLDYTDDALSEPEPESEVSLHDRLIVARMKIKQPADRDLPAEFETTRPEGMGMRSVQGFFYRGGDNNFYSVGRVDGVAEIRMSILRHVNIPSRFDFEGSRLGRRSNEEPRAYRIYCHQVLDSSADITPLLGRRTVKELLEVYAHRKDDGGNGGPAEERYERYAYKIENLHAVVKFLKCDATSIKRHSFLVY